MVKRDEYFDDRETLPTRRFLTKLFFGAIFLLVPVLGFTYAGNFRLNGDAPIEFGQGIAVASACDRSFKVTPLSGFKNQSGAGSFVFTGVKISELDGTSQTNNSDEGCAEKYFTLRAYGATGNTALSSFTFSLNELGVFSSGDGRTSASGESSSNSTLNLIFDEPAVLSSNIYKITAESSNGVINLATLSNFPNGIYVSSITNSRDDISYVIAGPVDGNNDFIQCNLYKSINLGQSWVQISTLPECFWYMTVSNDGSRLLAASWGGDIYTSSNSGVTWVNKGNPKHWWGFSSSGSGQVVIGITEKISVHVSRDYGQTWSTPAGLTTAGTFTKSAVSDDGQKMMIVDSIGYIYLSSDAGYTWAQKGEERNWYAATMSGDGSILYAAEGMDVGMTTGKIFTSYDFGNTWTPRSINNMWWQMRASYDGKTVVAMASDKIDSIFVSQDYGVTWRRTNQSYYFGDIALSRNGDVVIGSTSSTVFGVLRLHSAKIG